MRKRNAFVQTGAAKALSLVIPEMEQIDCDIALMAIYGNFNNAMMTAEEAAEWEAYENRRQNRDLIIDSVGGAGYPPGVISYNEFWYDRGQEILGDRRTSLITDPPNGRIPELTAAAQQRNQSG